MRRNDIIKRDYELREKHKFSNYTYRVFAHKGMGDLYGDLVEHYKFKQLTTPNGWHFSNPDFGSWDAFVVIHKTNTSYDIYVCGILAHPFTSYEQNEYEKTYLDNMTVNGFLLTFYDNRTKGDEQ